MGYKAMVPKVPYKAHTINFVPDDGLVKARELKSLGLVHIERIRDFTQKYRNCNTQYWVEYLVSPIGASNETM